MTKYLYEVRFDGERSDINFSKFRENISALNAKNSDYGGSYNTGIVSHPMDEKAVHVLCTDGFKRNGSGVTVTEITKKSLASMSNTHRLYLDLIRSYFLPYNDYPHIE